MLGPEAIFGPTMHPPARCRSCRHIFKATALTFQMVQTIVLERNTTRCPKCGGVAVIGDGLYSGASGKMVFVAGPDTTRFMIAKLASRAKEAKEGKIGRDELLAEFAGVSPEFAKKAERLGLPTFLIILFAFWLVKSFELNISIDVNKLFDQAHHWSQGVDPNAHDPLSNAPEPDFEAARPDPGAPTEDVFPRATLAVRLEEPLSKRARRRARGRGQKPRV